MERLRAAPPIALLLIAALAFRLLLAYGFFLGSGFRTDILIFGTWAQVLAQHGPGEFYDQVASADYPPAYLYVLWAIGSAGSIASSMLGGGTISFGGETFGLDFAIDAGLLKLPPIAADIAIGGLIYHVLGRWVPSASGRVRLGAASLYLFNPVAWYESALWGQIDGVGMLVILVALVLLVEGYSEAAVAAAVVAALIKPQYGVVLVPIVALVLLRRHLLAVGSGPRPQTPWPRLNAILSRQGPDRLIGSALAGVVLFALLVTPFGLDALSFLNRIQETAEGYPYLSANAYNVWAFVGAGGHEALAVSDPVGSALPVATGDWSPDTVPLLGSWTGVTIGAALLGLGLIVALGRLVRDDSRSAILVAFALASLAFFLFPTRVHERYLFPVFGVLPLLAVGSRSTLLANLAASAAALVNLHAVLTLPGVASPDLTALPFGDETRAFPLILGSVLTQVAVFVYLVVRPPSFDDKVVG